MQLQEAFGADIAYHNLSVFSTYCWQDHVNEPFHDEWYDRIQDESMKRCLNEAPRNSAKTTAMARKAPIFLLGRNHDMKILILSRSGAKAESNLRFIKLNIESNDRVREVFPDLVPSSPWGYDRITVENSRIDGEVSIRAVGLEGSITGFRADLIIADDLVDKTNVMTENQREKVRDFWNEVVLPTLNPDGRVFVICTRWHSKDFYSELERDEAYQGNIWIIPAFKLDNNQNLILGKDNQPISYWPSRWPSNKLLEIKREIGTVSFNCQYLQNPSGYEGLLFNPEHLHYYDPNKELLPILGALDIYVGVDPNISEDPQADNTAIATVALDRRFRNIYVLDIYAKPMGFVEQVKVIREHCTRAVPPFFPGDYEKSVVKVGVETVAYQKSLERTLYMHGLPVKEVTHSRRGKVERMIGLQPSFENGRLRFPDPSVASVPWWDGFFEEYVSFPRGRRDDMLDALEIAVDVAEVHGSGSTIPYGPGGVNSIRRFVV